MHLQSVKEEILTVRPGGGALEVGRYGGDLGGSRLVEQEAGECSQGRRGSRKEGWAGIPIGTWLL